MRRWRKHALVEVQEEAQHVRRREAPDGVRLLPAKPHGAAESARATDGVIWTHRRMRT